jgi:hypothetical protein
MSSSVWAELVAERQIEILRAAEGPMINVSRIAAVNAAKQDISRDDCVNGMQVPEHGCKPQTLPCKMSIFSLTSS